MQDCHNIPWLQQKPQQSNKIQKNHQWIETIRGQKFHLTHFQVKMENWIKQGTALWDSVASKDTNNNRQLIARNSDSLICKLATSIITKYEADLAIGSNEN